MQATMHASRTASPVSALDMGRTASKIEEVEDALSRLHAFVPAAVESVLGGYDKAASHPAQRQRGRRAGFAPGLRKADPGDIIGALSGVQHMMAKPIQSDRLEFRGEPAFDPVPFLDERSKEIFQSPILCALKPEEALEEPPIVKIHCDRGEKWKLLRKLDSCGRLGVVPEDQIVRGYQAGLFCVGKDLQFDRLIFDSRPFNTLEQPLGRWVRAMASISPLLDIQLSSEEVCKVSGTDLRDFLSWLSHQR